MIKYLALAAVITLSGCVSATVHDESICKVSKLDSIPGSSSGIDATISFSIDSDLSAVFNKLDDYSDTLSVSVTKLDLDSTQDLGWISDASILVTGNSSYLPEVALARLHPGGKGKKLTFDITLDPDTLLKYLKSPVVLTYTVSGTAPTKTANISNTFCVSATGSLNKSL